MWWRWLMLVFLLLAGAMPVLAAAPLQDLSNWRPDGDLRILDGNWQLSWLEPEGPSQSIRLPFVWEEGTRRLWGEAGFGQIELSTHLRLPLGSAPLGLRLPRLHSAAAIWLNERLVSLRGQPGDALREQARLDSTLIPLPAGQTEVLLRIRLSNHLRHAGGVTGTIQIGELEVLKRQHDQTRALTLLAIGALLMLGLLTLATREVAVAPLAGMALLAALWLMTGCELLDGRFRLSAEGLLRASWLAPWLMPPLQAMLLIRLFPGLIHGRPVRWLLLVAIAGLLPGLLLPLDLLELLLLPGQIWLLAGLLLAIVLSAQAWREQREGATAVLLGLLVLALAQLPGREFLPMALAALVFCQALPLYTDDCRTMAQVQPQKEPAGGAVVIDEVPLPEGVRILLVEAPGEPRQQLQERLLARGARVSVASDGVQAVAECAVREFDLLLLDMHLPGVLLSCEEIREQAGIWAPALVGLGEPDVLGWQAAGIVSVLPRPLSLRALARLLPQYSDAPPLSEPPVAEPSPVEVPEKTAGHQPHPVVDLAGASSRLDDLRRWLGGEQFELLLPSLLNSLREVEQGLKEVDLQDQDACSRLCHRLRGSALNFGLEELAEASREVRSPARLSQLQSMLVAQIDELENCLAQGATKVDCSKG